MRARMRGFVDEDEDVRSCGRGCEDVRRAMMRGVGDQGEDVSLTG